MKRVVYLHLRSVLSLSVSVLLATQPIDEEDVGLQENRGLCILPPKNQFFSSHDDPRLFNAHVKDDIVLSTSQATSASLIGSQAYLDMYHPSQQIPFALRPTSSRLAKSAEMHYLHANPSNKAPARPKSLMNPFAPASIRIPMAPGRRRWAHTFPMGPNRIPWHFHHVRQTEAMIRRKMLLKMSSSSHMGLPGTSKQVLDGFVSKRVNHHAKTNSDFSSRQKRY